MTTVQIVNQEQFAGKFWKRPDNYSYARSKLASTLSIGELKRALLTHPIGFIKNDNRYQCVALFGIFDQQNICVSERGHWINGYIPNEIKAYPFSLVKSEMSSEEYLVCIDSDSNLITQNSSDFPFFLEDCSYGNEFQEVIDFLTLSEQGGSVTDTAIANLEGANLIKPWDISVETTEGVHHVNGLHHIDESLFSDLKATELEKLRNSGSLYMAYCQILATQHLSTLIATAQKTLSKETQNGPKDSFLGSDSGTISFDKF
jgi:hypothetical protein